MAKYNVYDCSIIELSKHHSDRKGNISVVQNGDTVPFDVKRVYYLYDIPGVRDADHNTAFHLIFQKKTVKQDCISLTDSRFIDQCAVCRILNPIIVILQMLVIVSDIVRDIIVDRFDLLVLTLAFQSKISL